MQTDHLLKRAMFLWAALLLIPVPLLAQRPEKRSSSPQAASVPTPNPRPCLSYEPTVVEITGSIIRKTFPGPPNYESIAHGDTPEVTWLLVLPHSACVEEGKADPDSNPAQKDIREIQLVFMDPSAYKTYKELFGKKVVAKGTLFAAHTGHHHTPVLLIVGILSKAP